MTTTMKESAARHMAAGVEDLDELARLVEQDTGRTPGSATLADYRSRFRRSGEDWIEVERARVNSLTNRWRGENYAQKLLGACRGSAKQRDHECTITAENVEAMLAPMTCSVTGLPLSLEHGGDSARNPWAPSIDRLDCSEGYVPGNVRVVCVLYNLARGDFPDEAVMTMAKALAARAPDCVSEGHAAQAPDPQATVKAAASPGHGRANDGVRRTTRATRFNQQADGPMA